MRSSKTGHKKSCVASAVWHVASSCWNQMLPISYSSIFVNKNSFNMARYRSQLTLRAHFRRKKWPNYASWLKSAPNSDSFWVRRLFNVCVRVFRAPNAIILIVHIPAKIKMSFIWKDDFFFAKIVKSNVAIFPSVVQAYMEPYSFGERIKLIICQIRHKLGVTIHEISTSWKKNVRWRTQ